MKNSFSHFKQHGWLIIKAIKIHYGKFRKHREVERKKIKAAHISPSQRKTMQSKILLNAHKYVP